MNFTTQNASDIQTKLQKTERAYEMLTLKLLKLLSWSSIVKTRLPGRKKKREKI